LFAPQKLSFLIKKRKNSLLIIKNVLVVINVFLNVKFKQRFSKSITGLKKIKNEIKNNKRRIDLFVGRRGFEPHSKIFFCSKEKFDLQIINSTKITITECFILDSVYCLVKLIPIKNLFKIINVVFRNF